MRQAFFQSPHSDYVTRCYFNVLSREVITAGSLAFFHLFSIEELEVHTYIHFLCHNNYIHICMHIFKQQNVSF